MPWIVERHRELYAKEYNYNEYFVSLVSDITQNFLAHSDPVRERCWIAERDGQRLGTIMLVKDKDAESGKVAKLRCLLVEPAARGLGLGKDLVGQCTKFAREAGYDKIRLWTNSELVGARRLYEREGYRLVSKTDDESLGVKTVAEYWEMAL
ncbi:hypothetical protein BDW74DRAFT_176678 [Aspergillus multicolor]|uniref:GNAT family N-acetyltransferase n=1 Tax=Aspergillus multicolor TaxID=41759 RepID=UPI003CCD1282